MPAPAARWTVAYLAASFLVRAPFAQAHENDHGAGAPRDAELGAVSFQTSCQPQVAADMNRGVALIHSFWHEESVHSFESAAAADPECAMAWWGLAMARFHLYSSTPTDAELAAGKEAIAK